jgi:RNA polymerase sigma-70 factor (ECF subfamily)
MSGRRPGKVRHTALSSANELALDFAKLGHPGSFEELVRRYSAFIYFSCYRITQDRQDAEDATQIAFLQLAVAIKSGKTINKPVGWLERVARNQAARIIRARSRARARERRVSKPERFSEQPAGTIDDAGVPGVVRDALSQLPDHYRLPIVLHYFGGMSIESIAQQLKTNPRTVGTRLHRGRRLLGKIIEKTGLTLEVHLLTQTLALTLPAAIACTIARRVTMAPPGVALSIMQTLQISLAGALRRKPLAVMVASVAACATLVGARTLDLSKWKLPSAQGVMKWISEIFQSRPVPSFRVETAFPPSAVSSIDLSIVTAPSVLSLGIGFPLVHDNHLIRPEIGVTTGSSSAPQGVAFKNGLTTGFPVAETSRDPLFCLRTSSDRFFGSNASGPFTSLPQGKLDGRSRDSRIGEEARDRKCSSLLTQGSAISVLSAGTAAADRSGVFQSLTVPDFASSGVKLRGYGKLSIAGIFDQNGRVVADGGGFRRLFDLKDVSEIHNSIENHASGTNGWYAVNGGILTLPPLHIDSSDSEYTWGEQADDPVLDLVNSVRLKANGLSHPGDLTLSLLTLADNQDQFDSIPGGWGVVGLWQIQRGDLECDSLDVTVRYNQLAASLLPRDGEWMTFLTYDGSWRALPWDEVSLDPSRHLIAGELTGSFQYFAIATPLEDLSWIRAPMSASVPEPASIACLLPGLMSGLMSRRRR